MISLKLTVKERIQLHLFDYTRFADSFDVPVQMTQAGIATNVWIDSRHVVQYVRPLMEEGLVQERSAHIQTGRRKRKVYSLTERGRLVAYKMRERLLAEPVQVRDAGEFTEERLGRVLREADGAVSLLDCLKMVDEVGAVDLTRAKSPSAAQFVEMVPEAPSVEHYVGREQELETLTSPDVAARVFAIQGPAGIGKTALAGMVMNKLQGSTNLFWHRIRSWDTPQSLLSLLGRFLKANGKPWMQTALKEGDLARAPEVLRENLPEVSALIVFDDAHEAKPEVVDLLRDVKDAVSKAREMRVLVLTRRSLGFYDRRDVLLENLVVEMSLKGLSREDVDAFLKKAGLGEGSLDIPPDLVQHPLFMRLVQAASKSGRTSKVTVDMHRFFEEEVYRQLSPPERRMMKVASLFKVPVPQESLYGDSELTHDVLFSLMEQSLVVPVGLGRFEVHDTTRDFFRNLVSPADLESLSPFVAESLSGQAQEAMARGEHVEGIHLLSNALEVVLDGEKRCLILEALGDAHEGIGELREALSAYERAGKVATSPTTVVRLHRKGASALQTRGRNAEAEAQVKAAFEVLGDETSLERAWLEIIRCNLAKASEEWEEAREYGRLALNLFSAFEDLAGEAQALLALGRIEIDAPDEAPEAAEDYFRRCLNIADLTGDDRLRTNAHISFAHLYTTTIIDPSKAEDHILAVETHPETLEDPHVKKSFLSLKGWFYLRLRADYQISGRCFEEAKELGTAIRSASTVMFSDYGLAFVHLHTGRVQRAKEVFEESLESILSYGYHGFALTSLWMLVECSLLLGNIGELRTYLRRFEEPDFAQGVESRPIVASVATGLSELLAGNHERVLRLFEKAITYPDQAYPINDAFPHFMFGVVLLTLGKDERGNEETTKAGQILKKYSQLADLEMLPTRKELMVQSLRRAVGLRPKLN